MKLTKEVRCERCSDYAFRKDGTLVKEKTLCIPRDKVLKESILEEAHSLTYTMHPSSTKMYRTLKAYY